MQEAMMPCFSCVSRSMGLDISTNQSSNSKISLLTCSSKSLACKVGLPFSHFSFPIISISGVIKSMWYSNQHLRSLSIRLSLPLLVTLMLTPYCSVDESAFANKFRSAIDWGLKSLHWMFLLNEIQRADCRSRETAIHRLGVELVDPVRAGREASGAEWGGEELGGRGCHRSATPGPSSDRMGEGRLPSANAEAEAQTCVKPKWSHAVHTQTWHEPFLFMFFSAHS